MFFQDRVDAGQKLAVALKQYEKEKPLISALPRFNAVSSFYYSFPQVSDEEVITILHKAKGRER